MPINPLLPFPLPPEKYNRSYMATLVQTFSTFVEQVRNPGEGRNTKLTLTALPGDDFGLEVGALFEVDGFVKIARSNVVAARSISATAFIGSVTVTT